MLIGFPDPVDEVAARTVAAGVVLLGILTLVTGWGWLLVPIALGFLARVVTGPKLSPLGRLATQVVVPRLPFAERPVPGPPKRFAQGMGLTVTTAAAIVALTTGFGTVAVVLVAALIAAATLESAFGICLGCIAFAGLMRLGVIPEEVCERCATVGARRPLTAGGPPPP